MTNLLDLITPTNLLEQKELFFASKNYHPRFHYLWQDQPVNPTFSILAKYPLWEAIQNQDISKIVSAASRLFETVISSKTFSMAEQVSQEKVIISHGSALELQYKFMEAFKQFNLDYQAVIVPDPGFNIRPQHAKKKLLISSDIHFGYFSMEGEVHHELVHILRYVNGKYNGIPRSQNFLPTEEGLATWCHDHINSDSSQVQHALEYLASNIGLRGSLRDIYDFLISRGMSPDLAWKRAARHKYGFVDTSLSGDILKPAMYFSHSLQVDHLTKSEKLRLFVGKVAQSELDQYPSYDGLIDKTKIIDYLKLE